jgi:2-phosphosulpholactate phosphatase
MNITSVTIDRCSEASGMAVVIDVLRAFTTAAFAFERGATDVDINEVIQEVLTLGEGKYAPAAQSFSLRCQFLTRASKQLLSRKHLRNRVLRS